jgi:hypothetical protein
MSEKSSEPDIERHRTSVAGVPYANMVAMVRKVVIASLRASFGSKFL